jgi:cholesterol transport system auxiliary component
MIANYQANTGAIVLFGRQIVFATLLVLTTWASTGCALPTAPPRPVVFDFGPGQQSPTAQATARGIAQAAALAAGGNSPQPAPAPRSGPLAPLALADVDASVALDSTAVLYRLVYADAQALRPYTLARWSMPPAQLLRQRLREQLGASRVVLAAGEAAALAPSPWLLRLELEEFSQLFDSPTASSGLVRLRATVTQATAQGDRLVGQRSFVAQRPAPSADAPGGVRALTQASDVVLGEVEAWLTQLATQPVSAR